MAFNYLATVQLEHTSGLARDRIVNTFAFECDGALLSADADTLAGRLETFYSAVGEGATRSIGSHLSAVISRSTRPTVRFYDVGTVLNGDPAGSPVWIRTFTNNLPLAVAAQGLPAEVSLCLSFHANFGTDVEFGAGSRPRARDRGRVYIGPLTTDALTGTTGNRCVPAANLINAILGAGKDLRDANDTKRWCVWSRRAARMLPVTSCSVNDGFDTQRRRGERPVVNTVL